MAEERSARGPPSNKREDPIRRDDDRYADERAPRPIMAAPMTLPSIHDPHGGYPPQGYARSYPPPDPRADPRGDPRASSYETSPSSVNGYPPPPPPPGGHGSQLPPLQPAVDPRSPTYPPHDARDDYYRDRQPPPQYDPYYQGYQGRPGQPPSRYPEYGQQGPPGGARYDYPPAPGPGARYDYGPPGGPQLQQAAPRQRTSIACRYCRKRKIRCSGYQSAPGGKCVNCSRMNQECIFQPVSSSSSTAFIPVSAVPGGVPPGTPLYGAYGQPLHPNSLPPPPQQYSAGNGGGYYQQPLPSPTTPYPLYDSQRQAGRRRQRGSEEGDELRPPPPGPGMDDERRRSPASSSNHSSPGGYAPYPSSGAGSFEARQPPPRHSPGQHQGGTALPMQSDERDRASASSQRHSNSSTPAATSNSVMSLNNLVDSPSDIDRNMLGRLNRGSGARK